MMTMMIRKKGRNNTAQQLYAKKEEKNAMHLCPAYLSVLIFHQPPACCSCWRLICYIGIIARLKEWNLLSKLFAISFSYFFLLWTSVSVSDLYTTAVPTILVSFFVCFFLFFPHSFTSSFSSSSFWLADQRRNYLHVIF